jgi:hypothetical protein
MKLWTSVTKCFLCLSTLPLLATQEQTANSYFEPMNQSQQLSTEQLLTIQNEIYNRIQLNKHKLLFIRERSGSLIEKWQELLQVILPIQMDVIKAYSLGDNQVGLSKFNEEYARCSSKSTALCKLTTQKWLFIFDKTFGITEFKEISLQEAQSLTVEIAEEMTSETFLAQIDHAINALKPDASLIEKRQLVLTILFPLHMSVMARHGFDGETGYIQAQRAIMDYYHDPLIAQKAAYAQSVVFRRAQLIQ